MTELTQFANPTPLVVLTSSAWAPSNALGAICLYRYPQALKVKSSQTALMIVAVLTTLGAERYLGLIGRRGTKLLSQSGDLEAIKPTSSAPTVLPRKLVMGVGKVPANWLSFIDCAWGADGDCDKAAAPSNDRADMRPVLIALPVVRRSSSWTG